MSDQSTNAINQPIDIDNLKDWIGRQEVTEDCVSAVPIEALSATLDRTDVKPETGDPLPLPWHWLFFLPAPLASELSIDGHPVKGGFLPPVPLPKRMWAGGMIKAIDLPRVGDAIKRVSTIGNIVQKTGASGNLVFVTVDHEIFADGRLALTERQDLVYREAPTQSSQAKKQPARSNSAVVDNHNEPNWSRTVHASTSLLFRFSALTFNSHRIHYDKDYAMEVEGYPDLVVHGPLQATLLFDLLRCELPNMRVTQFDYRAMNPLFANRDFYVEGKIDSHSSSDNSIQKVYLWTRSDSGQISMSAEAMLEPI